MFKKALAISLILSVMVLSFTGCKKDDKKATATVSTKTTTTTSKTDSKTPGATGASTSTSNATSSSSTAGTATTASSASAATAAPTAYTGETFTVSELILDSTTNPTVLFFNFKVDSSLIDTSGKSGWIEITPDNPQWKTTAEKVTLNGKIKMSDIEGFKAWFLEDSKMVSFWVPVNKYTFNDGDVAVFDANFGTYDSKILGEKMTWTFDGASWTLE